MVRRVLTLAFVGALTLVGALALEVLYRGYLFLRYPHHFETPRIESFVSWSASIWRYDNRFGYDYIPSQVTTQATVSGQKVVGCTTQRPVNAEGNIGPSTPDYADADFKVALFGDSFSAHVDEGVTWPFLLQGELEKATGRKVRILNLARDGFGVLQMFDMAAVKIAEFKPDLVLFAFNTSALRRGRAWRVETGSGPDARLITTTENSRTPSEANSSDMALLIPAATQEWCESIVKRQDQANDPTLQFILARSANLLSARPAADLFDWHASYVLDRILYHNPLASQWYRIPSALNPVVTFQDFADDPQFVRSLKTIEETKIPYVIVHLPMGVSLKERQEFYFLPGDEQLLQSLEWTMHRSVVRLGPSMRIEPTDAMKLCRFPNDCHPSRFGMDAYAKVTSQAVAPFLIAAQSATFSARLPAR